MRHLWFALVILVIGLGSVADAQDPRWETDTSLLDEMLADVQASDVAAVDRHVSAVEEALAAAPTLFSDPIAANGTTVVLVESSAENLLVLAKAAEQGSGDVATVFNPYPRLALYLSVFYVEVGRYDDAVRVIDAGLALSPAPDDLLGDTVPELLSERGIALGRLHRLEEALATYDKGIAIPQMEDAMRAVLYRGRGFVLIEMSRLDEAEAAYNTSLELDPGNQIATNELAYIASLRAGGKPAEPTLTIQGNTGKTGKTGG